MADPDGREVLGMGCSRFLAGIAGSNAAGGIDVCLCECCVL